MENGKTDNNGSYFAYADFGDTSNNNDAIIEAFSATLTVPSAPAHPYDALDITIGIGLQAYNNTSLVAVYLVWDTTSMLWYASLGYRHDNEQSIRGSGLDTRPGHEIDVRIALHHREKYKYDVSFLIDNNRELNETIEMSCALNQAVVNLGTNTDNYRYLPQDERVRIRNISVELPMTGGIPNPTTEIDWKFDTIGILTPSRRNGVIVNNSIAAGEIDFYLR